MSAEDILSLPPPPCDQRVAYGADPNQFLEVRLPSGKGPFPALLNIHGGFWRAKYGLAHAGHLCEALRRLMLSTAASATMAEGGRERLPISGRHTVTCVRNTRGSSLMGSGWR